MRILRIAFVALLGLAAFPAMASAETADGPIVCTADGPVDVIAPTIVVGSAEFVDALGAGATFVAADEAVEAETTCFAVFEVSDEDGNFIGYLLVPVDDSFCE